MVRSMVEFKLHMKGEHSLETGYRKDDHKFNCPMCADWIFGCTICRPVCNCCDGTGFKEVDKHG